MLAGSRLPDEDLLQLAEQRAVVLLNRQVASLPSVVTDSADAGRQIIAHLAALGHRSVTYLGGPANAWSDGARWRALAASAEEAGIKVIRRGPFAPTLEGGSAAADIGMASETTALVAFNDLLAIGVLQRLQHLGIDVPGEVSVVGYDDIFGSDFCHPPLTTITAPIEQAGRTLIDLLLGVRDVQRAPHIVLPTVLRARNSTGPAKPAGPSAPPRLRETASGGPGRPSRVNRQLSAGVPAGRTTQGRLERWLAGRPGAGCSSKKRMNSVLASGPRGSV